VSRAAVEQYLMVKPGVWRRVGGPFRPYQNRERDVVVLLGREVAEAGKVEFHPNDNAASLVLQGPVQAVP
jgi:hypothetical protein